MEEVDYEAICEVYNAVKEKERIFFEVQKNKKVNDMEIWARALREEEKISMAKYCKEHGAEEMENIAKAIRDKHEKEIVTKNQLFSAKSSFDKYREVLMAKRTAEHV